MAAKESIKQPSRLASTVTEIEESLAREPIIARPKCVGNVPRDLLATDNFIHALRHFLL